MLVVNKIVTCYLRFSAARRDGNDISACKSMNYDNAICAINDAYGGVRSDIHVWVQTARLFDLCRMSNGR